MKAMGAWPLSTLNQQGSMVWEVLPDWPTREAHVVDSVRCVLQKCPLSPSLCLWSLLGALGAWR